MTTFPERLRELREDAQLKQEDMAKKLNITTSAYGYYEQGRNEPSLNALQTLSVLFDTSTDYLIGLTNVKNPPLLIKVTEELSLSNEEIQLMIELKKYSQFIADLEVDPETKVAKLYKLWKFIKDEIE
ncbi:XRE family transcriptional regulator [Sporolactobacillus shoreae]|uniref:XRE family transcriptional regulator n=1 Tax=Sporolactobacillus shoreae TaxID=1465501 RepID=A0A4Z0GNL3_9BACL|nr:helix-turn-helix transcriptional regulator [Sporolactobacillus shoreae]TGA98500.1 XRE family transcriptional regulator [Sporolactobacillus shoreae]